MTARAAAGLVVAVLLSAGGARANDSMAELSLGGLSFTKSDAISMDSEDLYISRERVRVRYRFTNHSDATVESLVAFPLPDLPPYSEENYDELNFWPDARKRLQFRTLVDGKPAALDFVEQAVFGGEDVTTRLAALGIPLNRFAEGFDAALARLPKAQRDKLVADGLLLDRSAGVGEAEWEGLWTLRTSVTRKQGFPPKASVAVEHAYAPVTGGSVGGGFDKELRDEPGSSFSYERKKYCVDDDWLASFDAAAKKRRSSSSDPGYTEIWIGYVLKTGANWKGPIGDFRLVVDKGKADSLVSFCAEGVRKISPTQFEVRRKDYTPDADLDILIVEWAER